MFKRGLRSQLRRWSPANLQAARVARDPDVLLVDWVNRGPVRTNWGDAIAPLLVERLSGKRVANQRDVLNLARKPVYTTIGSMLGTIATPRAEVWGSGFVDSASQLQVRPAKIHALRGPRSLEKLRDAGVDAPDVFGDPALLAPYFWAPSAATTHRLGIIPHFRDTHLPTAARLATFPGVKLIDIRGGIQEVVDEITSCERIASGSLHGLVAADAYGLPAVWIEFSDAAYGDGFKFRDYLQAAGGRGLDPLRVTPTTEIDEIEALFGPPCMEVDMEAFIAACPFLDPALLPAAPLPPR